MSLQSRKNFTLMELLVVITVIAILASLLLPALQGAFRSVYRIDCANKLHQIGAASVAYTGDFNFYILRRKWRSQFTSPPTNNDQYYLPYFGSSAMQYFKENYLGNKKFILMCPTMKKLKEPGPTEYSADMGYQYFENLASVPSGKALVHVEKITQVSLQWPTWACTTSKLISGGKQIASYGHGNSAKIIKTPEGQNHVKIDGSVEWLTWTRYYQMMFPNWYTEPYTWHRLFN